MREQKFLYFKNLLSSLKLISVGKERRKKNPRLFPFPYGGQSVIKLEPGNQWGPAVGG